MRSSSDSFTLSDSSDSGWRQLDNGTYVRVSSSLSSTSSGSSSSVLEPSDELETGLGLWVWSDTSQRWEWFADGTEVHPTQAAFQDSAGWVQQPDGTFVRKQSSWFPWSSSETRGGQHDQGRRATRGSTRRCEDYEQDSSICSNVGTFNCGNCECPADFFGVNCECSAGEIPFNSDLGLQVSAVFTLWLPTYK